MTVNHFQENPAKKSANTFPLVYLGFLTLFLYIVWIVGQSVYAETKNQRDLKQRQSELEQTQLQAEIKQKYIEYQKTDNYIELQAREHFGYAKPGETIINLPERFISDTSVVSNNESSNNALEKVNTSNPSLWWLYFFGKK